jgi:uncharacterized protein YdhG (YjbR/CyaY superfamily)
MELKEYRTIDEYIDSCPAEIRGVLEELRQKIRKAAPGAKEVISYGMPAFKQSGVLVYFAAHKTHIGFYPTASGIENFKQEFSKYKYSKGAVQFPLDKPLPYDLIERIVKFRLKEDQAKKKK